MASLTYVGDRAYVEFTHEGIKYGFSRGLVRDDIPVEMLEVFKGDNFPQWAVSDLKAPVEVKTEEMVAIVEEDDSTSDASPFNPNWTRGEMIKWFSARGETVPRTATKASLTARAEALLNPPAEEAVEEEAPEEVAEEESTTEGESEGDE